MLRLQDAGCLGTQLFGNAVAEIDKLNAGTLACTNYTGSFTDWRWPNVRELLSLADWEAGGPLPFLNLASGYLSSSRTFYTLQFPGPQLQARLVNPTTGLLGVINTTFAESAPLWAVRGGTCCGGVPPP